MNTKLTELLAKLPRSNRDLNDWDNQAFYDWQSERTTQSGGYAPSGTDRRDRYNRCMDAAENGSDGSTHAEHIEDLRDWMKEVFRDIGRAANKLVETDEEETEAEDIINAAYTACEASIDECEAWHEKNGSLQTQCG